MNVYAGIDIGTNTILMTIAKGNRYSDFEVLDDMHSIARLGEDVDKTGLISQDAIKRAEIILKDYYELMKKRKVDKAIAVCTSSMRRAKNSREITQLFRKILNCEVIIISGEEEAELSFIGTIETPEQSMVIDIGGGSTEIIIGENFQVNYRVSTELGAVRLTETFLKNNPPTRSEVETIVSHIHKHIRSLPFGNFTGKVYSVAGTATSLAAIDLNLKFYDFEKIHNYTLLRCRIKSITDKLLKMTAAEIEHNFNIPQKRADVLPAGALILYEILQSINIDRTIISCYGLRYGIVKRLLDNKPIKSII
jgi:exopolyphosphatase/guanosine-5'-triphosphate,3'-diphosphate pyrophosphatase